MLFIGLIQWDSDNGWEIPVVQNLTCIFENWIDRGGVNERVCVCVSVCESVQQTDGPH